MRTKKGRSLVGTRAQHVVRNLRSKNISVCCAINKSGVKKFAIQDFAFNTVTFLAFMTEFLNEIGVADICGKKYFIMDNVPFHKASELRELIESYGHNLLFLPPYSPFLNCIENMFSQSKQFVKQSRVNTSEELLVAIKDSFLRITVENCANYYRNMLKFLTPCLNNLPIVDE